MNIRLTNPSVESHEKNLICYLTNRGSTKYNDFDWLLIYIRSTNHGSTISVELQLSQPFNIPSYLTNRGSTKYNDFDWLLIYIRLTNHVSTDGSTGGST